MTIAMDPDPSAVNSREELSRFLLELTRNVEAGRFPMENESSVEYVKAAAYWIRSMHRFFENRGEEAPEQPEWKTIAMIFSAAFVYE